MFRTVVTLTFVAAACAACGGGGSSGNGSSGGGGGPGGTPSVPQTAVGRFIDAAVEGLSYTSGDQTGVTDAQGRFTYEIGKEVTFRVGAVTIGTAPGASVITPLDLVQNGSSASTTVQNIVRFLMLTDADGDPSNGITISEGLRSRAQDWPQVDFTANDLETELASIIPDTSVDGSIRTLRPSADAQSHLEASFRCLYSGLFEGTYKGEDEGRWGMYISPWGLLSASVYSTIDQAGMQVGFSDPSLPVRYPIALTGTTPYTSFTVQFTSLNTITGNTAGNQETLTGTRVAGSSEAAYKFLVALINPPPGGLYPAVPSLFLEIDHNGQVIATVPTHLGTGQRLSATATLTGDSLTVTISNGTTVTGTVDRTLLSVSGDWTNPSQGIGGQILSIGPGCGL